MTTADVTTAAATTAAATTATTTTIADATPAGAARVKAADGLATREAMPKPDDSAGKKTIAADANRMTTAGS